MSTRRCADPKRCTIHGSPPPPAKVPAKSLVAETKPVKLVRGYCKRCQMQYPTWHRFCGMCVDVQITDETVYPTHRPAKFCPNCGAEPRCVTKKVLPRSVRLRWLCPACRTLFDVFHGGR